MSRSAPFTARARHPSDAGPRPFLAGRRAARRPATFPRGVWSGRLSGLRVVPPSGRRARPLRGVSRVLGGPYRDRLEGPRAHHHLPRAAVPAVGPAGGADRVAARFPDRELRLGGPGAARRGGQQGFARSGRRGAVSAPAPFAGIRTGNQRGPGPVAGRGAGGGPHHGRSPGEAPAVRGVGLSGGVGAGAAGVPGTPARARRSPPPGRAVSGGAGEPRVPGMAGGGDLPCPDRGTAVAEGKAGPGAGGTGDGCARRHPSGGRIRSPARSSGRRRRGATKKAAGKRPLRACSQYSEPGASRRLRVWPRTGLSSAVLPAMP